jgi:hypothetical protein
MTPRETAAYLGISLSTLYEWMGTGILIAGRHYFQHGRIRLFVGGPRLIRLLIKEQGRAQQKPTPNISEQRIDNSLGGPVRPHSRYASKASTNQAYLIRLANRSEREEVN